MYKDQHIYLPATPRYNTLNIIDFAHL